MASSSSASQEFFGNCAQCSKIDVKLFPCPVLGGRGRHPYSDLPSLPLHPQFVSRSPSQCCPTTQPVYPSLPVRLHSTCNCSRCITTNIERRLTMSPHMAGNSCWLNNPVEIHHTNLTRNLPPNILQNQPCLPQRHVGMAAITPMDGLPLHSALSYHHHHHFHHYHYHHHTQSRNNLHPYALPVLHPRLRRQAGRTSRLENPIPPNFVPIITSDTRLRWEQNLETEQLENVVNLGELIVDEKPKGISKSILENLPTYRVASKVKNISESRCVICLMEFEQKQQVRILPCHHEYHSKCIDKWLKSNRSCPICRKEITI